MTPNKGRRSRQGQLLVSTNTTAADTARSSTGALPPPCGRGVNRGIKGSSVPTASETKCRDKASTTVSDHGMEWITVT